MGLLSKLKPKNLLKKSVGAKLVKKAISKDPIGSKVLGKSKGAQAMGLVNKPGKRAPAAGKVMGTGGNNRPVAAAGRASRGNAAMRMDALQRPQRPTARLRRTP